MTSVVMHVNMRQVHIESCHRCSVLRMEYSILRTTLEIKILNQGETIADR